MGIPGTFLRVASVLIAVTIWAGQVSAVDLTLRYERPAPNTDAGWQTYTLHSKTSQSCKVHYGSKGVNSPLPAGESMNLNGTLTLMP